MAVPGQQPGLGPGTQAISQIPLVIPLGPGIAQSTAIEPPGAGPLLWKAGPWSPPQASVEPELDLYFDRDWIDMPQRNSPSNREAVTFCQLGVWRWCTPFYRKVE